MWGIAGGVLSVESSEIASCVSCFVLKLYMMGGERVGKNQNGGGVEDLSGTPERFLISGAIQKISWGALFKYIRTGTKSKIIKQSTRHCN